MHRGERHLGGRDGPQSVPLQVVRLLGEFRQVAGRDHGLGQHQRRRPDLLVGRGVAVEGEGRQGPEEPGPHPPVQREHRPRHPGATFHVEQAELLADLPVRHLLVGRRRRFGLARFAAGPPPPDLDVVVGTTAIGGLVGRQVRQVEQRGPQGLGCAASASPAARPLPLTQARLSSASSDARDSSPDRLASDPRDRAFTFGPKGLLVGQPAAMLGVELGQKVDFGGADPAAGQRRLHDIRVVRVAADVDHADGNGSMQPVRRADRPPPAAAPTDRPRVHRPGLRLGRRRPPSTASRFGLAGRSWPCSDRRRRQEAAPSRRSRATAGPPRRCPGARTRSDQPITASVTRMGTMLQRGGVYPCRPRRVLDLFASYYPDPGTVEPARAGLARPRAADPVRNVRGEQQRLGLALALSAGPRSSSLDEPTAGVDPEGRQSIRSVVAALRGRGGLRPVDHPRPGRGRAAGRPGGRWRPRGARRGRGHSRRNWAAGGATSVVTFGAPPGLDSRHSRGATLRSNRPTRTAPGRTGRGPSGVTGAHGGAGHLPGRALRRPSPTCAPGAHARGGLPGPCSANRTLILSCPA